MSSRRKKNPPKQSDFAGKIPQKYQNEAKISPPYLTRGSCQNISLPSDYEHLSCSAKWQQSTRRMKTNMELICQKYERLDAIMGPEDDDIIDLDKMEIVRVGNPKFSMFTDDYKPRKFGEFVMCNTPAKDPDEEKILSKFQQKGEEPYTDLSKILDDMATDYHKVHEDLTSGIVAQYSSDQSGFFERSFYSPCCGKNVSFQECISSCGNPYKGDGDGDSSVASRIQEQRISDDFHPEEFNSSSRGDKEDTRSLQSGFGPAFDEGSVKSGLKFPVQEDTIFKVPKPLEKSRKKKTKEVSRKKTAEDETEKENERRKTSCSDWAETMDGVEFGNGEMCLRRSPRLANKGKQMCNGQLSKKIEGRIEIVSKGWRIHADQVKMNSIVEIVDSCRNLPTLTLHDILAMYIQRKKKQDGVFRRITKEVLTTQIYGLKDLQNLSVFDECQENDGNFGKIGDRGVLAICDDKENGPRKKRPSTSPVEIRASKRFCASGPNWREHSHSDAGSLNATGDDLGVVGDLEEVEISSGSGSGPGCYVPTSASPKALVGRRGMLPAEDPISERARKQKWLEETKKRREMGCFEADGDVKKGERYVRQIIAGAHRRNALMKSGY